MIPRLVEEELERVGRHRRDLVVRIVRAVGLLQAAVVDELDAPLVELLVDGRDLLVREVDLRYELLERGQVDAALLLALVDERPQLIMGHEGLVSEVRIGLTPG